MSDGNGLRLPCDNSAHASETKARRDRVDRSLWHGVGDVRCDDAGARCERVERPGL